VGRGRNEEEKEEEEEVEELDELLSPRQSRTTASNEQKPNTIIPQYQNYIIIFINFFTRKGRRKRRAEQDKWQRTKTIERWERLLEARSASK